MGARYYDPIVGRFTQPESAWSNPMFNTLGGRNLLVGRGYGTGAGVGQETTPMPGGYYRPFTNHNLYGYAEGNPVNLSDVSGEFPVWPLIRAIVAIAYGAYRLTYNQDRGQFFWQVEQPAPAPSPSPPVYGPSLDGAPVSPIDIGSFRIFPVTPEGPSMRRPYR